LGSSYRKLETEEYIRERGKITTVEIDRRINLRK
jgi:hypothetical protein